MANYKQAIEYLESFIDYEKFAGPYDIGKWKLERVEKLLELIGNPHHGKKFIHVAGTKGKGSTSAMIASVLKSAGFKVGLYISPHLVDFRERISINGEMISEDQVCQLITQMKPYVDYLKSQEEQYGSISFFDVYTALALLYFAIEDTDFTVLEVGMGGRLDATNVVTPLVSIITQISYDHIQSLGNTLTAIAREKTGIIKKNGYVVSSPQEAEAMNVIEIICKSQNAKLFKVGEDISFQKNDDNTFDVSGIINKYENIHVNLLGDHQLINAVTAIGSLEVLSFHGYKIPSYAISDGLEKVKWRARIEVIQKDPIIILDVAHNAASAKALRDTIKSNFKYNKLILILGSSMHKDIKGMGRYLCPIADHVILTKVNNPRAMNPEDVYEELKDHNNNFIITKDVLSAFKKAKSIADPHDLICITGSVYLAGEIISLL